MEKLQESARFTGKDKIKLQRFADICADVEKQKTHLPGLACLNYANTIRPIVDNLPNFLRFKWEKEVVKYAEENSDEYPGFQRFATMVKKQARLRNHPNVLAGEPPDNSNMKKKGSYDGPPKQEPPRRVLKSELNDDRNGGESD
jgi:hypothetical protein